MLPVAPALLSGQLIAETSFNAPVNVTATTEASAQTLLGPTASFALNGSTEIIISWFIPEIDTTAQQWGLTLFDGASDLMRPATGGSPTATIQMMNGSSGFVALTPSAGSHTYTLGGWVVAGGGTVVFRAGTGGAGNLAPGFLRITRS